MRIKIVTNGLLKEKSYQDFIKLKKNCIPIANNYSSFYKKNWLTFLNIYKIWLNLQDFLLLKIEINIEK